jgi:hypothetical protein
VNFEILTEQHGQMKVTRAGNWVHVHYLDTGVQGWQWKPLGFTEKALWELDKRGPDRKPVPGRFAWK